MDGDHPFSIWKTKKEEKAQVLPAYALDMTYPHFSQTEGRKHTDCFENSLSKVTFVRNAGPSLRFAKYGGGIPQELPRDELVFRFNRRSSGSRGLLFHRMLEAAIRSRPKPH